MFVFLNKGYLFGLCFILCLLGCSDDIINSLPTEPSSDPAVTELGLRLIPHNVELNLEGLSQSQIDQISLGSYLVNGAAGCIGCHNSATGEHLAGGNEFPAFFLPPDIQGNTTLFARNLTPDPDKSETPIAEASQAAENLGLELIKVPVSSSKKVPNALRSMLGKIDALWMVPDDTVLTTQSFRFFLVTSFEKKLPFLAISDIFVKVGALATIAPDPIEMGQQLRQLVSKIQSGQLDLTKTNILSPAETHLVINVKTAEKIGLIIAPEILQTASKLYQ